MSTQKPLEGIKVIEMGQLIAGPFAGRIFAEFGAEVIKIEPPASDGQAGGDPLRQWRKLHDGTSLWWYAQARNKKSVTVNLRLAEGQEIVRTLARDADIVIENFRPGTMEKWGLGYERLAAENPGLIMLRLSGFGQTGPYRDQAGFGAIGESMGGLRYITGHPDRAPVRPNLSIGDSLASLHGVIGAMMALHHRNMNGGRASGKGQVVDVALYEAVFSMMESTLPEFDMYGIVRRSPGADDRIQLLGALRAPGVVGERGVAPQVVAAHGRAQPLENTVAVGRDQHMLAVFCEVGVGRHDAR